jgi:hypothetical protein
MIRRSNHILPWIIFLLIPAGNVISQVSFDYSSEYRYLKGNEALDLPDSWMDADFNDSGWETGLAPFWYGDGAGGTVLTDMKGNYSTLYLRSEFSAGNIQRLKELIFYIDYDDGFVMWMNGEEILRQNAPSVLSYDAFAPVNHESGVPETFIIDSSGINLIEGTNSVAIQLFNMSLSSTDIHFKMNITATPALPELDSLINPLIFSHEAGFYESPFELTISVPDSTAGIIYTLDCSNPRISSTAITGDSSVTIVIDPAGIDGRAATPAVIVRASMLKLGFAPSIPETRTFIFVNSVRDQTWPGYPWPSTSINGQIMDYDMDSEVVNDGRYTSLIEEALLDIPSLSLVSDNDNLFNPSYGIYVNADNYGVEWERDCSLELIDPERSGFQVNAGMRIRGGASRGPDNPKHAFRLFFKKEYGDPKLEFPLFGDEGTKTFDHIDIRTEQNFAWNRDSDPWGDYNTFVRDIYARKMQGEMDQPYARSRYYHLYLNGLYWGLFMTEERPEASYAESYFGDDKEDYDVIKVTTQVWPYYNIATDGNMDTWEDIWNMCLTGFSSNVNYFRLEGNDANGKHIKGSNVYVNIDNLIDYMMMIFYTGSYDAPVSAWGGETMPNNYFAIYNRKNKGSGFVFIAHDMEQCLFVDQISVAEGLYENRVTIPDMQAANLLMFQPQWLHHRLCANAEYRLRFADHAFKYLSEGGLFTEETGREKFMEFADIIDKAIIAESARWGDAKVSVPRTRDDDWLPALAQVTDIFFPQRTEIVIDQLIAADLYTDIQPPRFIESGNTLTAPVLYFDQGLSVKIENSNGNGDIIYTYDGSDPRQIGGITASTALISSSDVTVEIDHTTIIKSRIKEGDNWSAMVKKVFAKQVEDYTNLKVTELHYHPLSLIIAEDTIDAKDMEFIEFKNTGNYSIDISGLVLDSAVSYTVPEATFLSPGNFYVLASKPEVFYDIYGFNPNGNYSGNFSNTGEYLLVTSPTGNEIISFTYDDNYPWPVLADGEGNSLTSAAADPTGDPDDYSYWKNSSLAGGTPFANDDGTTSTEPDPDKINQSVYRVFPNPAVNYFTVTSNNSELTEFFIYNKTGQLVYSDTFRSEVTISSDQLGESGVYFIRLINKDTISTEKIVIL